MSQSLLKYNNKKNKAIKFNKHTAIISVLILFICFNYANSKSLKYFEIEINRKDNVLDIDTTETFGKDFISTIEMALKEIENVIVPRYDSKAKILFSTYYNQSSPAIAIAKPIIENFAVNKNRIITGRLWQKFNTKNLRDSEIDCKISINMAKKFTLLKNEPKNNEFDLYTVLIHEIIHGLGVLSGIDKGGISAITKNRCGEFSLFDTRINNSQVLRVSKNICFEKEYANLLDASCSLGITNFDSVLFSPNTWIKGSSISHLGDECINTPNRSIMSHVGYPGEGSLSLEKLEYVLLHELGYLINEKRLDSIFSIQELLKLSQKIPIVNNDFINYTVDNFDGTVSIPIEEIIKNDTNIDKVYFFPDFSVSIVGGNLLTKNDTLRLEIISRKNPIQLNYLGVSESGLLSNSGLLSIFLRINEKDDICLSNRNNLLCNGDFESAYTTGLIKVKPRWNYPYNYLDDTSTCSKSKYLDFWKFSYRSEIISYLESQKLPPTFDPYRTVFLEDSLRDLPFRDPFHFLQRPNNNKKNNFFVGLMMGIYSQSEFYKKEKKWMVSLYQNINKLGDIKYYNLKFDYAIDPNKEKNNSIFIALSKNDLCREEGLDFQDTLNYKLIEYKINRNVELVWDAVSWETVEIDNIELEDYNFIYIFANRFREEGTAVYMPKPIIYFDNIILTPNMYKLSNNNEAINICEDEYIEYPIELTVKKEDSISDTVLVNYKINDLEAVINQNEFILPEGVYDTTLKIGYVLIDNSILKNDVIGTYELISAKTDFVYELSQILSFTNKNSQTEISLDSTYCPNDTIIFNMNLLYFGYNEIRDGKIIIRVKKPNNYICDLQRNSISISNNLMEAFYYYVKSDSLYWYINLHIQKSNVTSTGHINTDSLYLNIHFPLKTECFPEFIDYFTIVDLGENSCIFTSYDTTFIKQTIYSLPKDTTVCDFIDISDWNLTKPMILEGPKLENPMFLNKSGTYLISYLSQTGCYQIDSLKLNVLNELKVESTVTYENSKPFQLSIKNNFNETFLDTINFLGSKIIKIFPVIKSVYRSRNGISDTELNFYSIEDTLIINFDFDIKSKPKSLIGEALIEIDDFYPLNDSIYIQIIDYVSNVCSSNRTTYIQDISLDLEKNRLYNYRFKNHIVSLFPNPASNELNVIYELVSEQSYKMNIYSLKGDLIYSENHHNLKGTFRHRIDINSMINGVYIFELAFENSSNKRLFIINK